HAADPRGPHHHQLAVVVQLVQRKQRRSEKRDRDDHHQEARQHQQGQIGEDERRLSAIDDEIEQAQRLGHPDHKRQQQREQQKRRKDLTQDVKGQLSHSNQVSENEGEVSEKMARMPSYLISDS